MSVVGVIGQGYVGLSLSVSAAKAGHKVIGFDTSDSVIKSLISLKSTITHISDKEIKNIVLNKSYYPTSDPKHLSECEIIVIAVPTPLDALNNPDLTFIKSAIQIIIQNISKKVLIINESTSFPGTLRNIIVKEIEDVCEIKHDYASAPERIDPGNATWTLANTPRLISGISREATDKARKFYESFTSNVVGVSTPEIAEMSKLLENTFRQVNIALINQISQICYELDIDVREVISAAETKPFGFMKFLPGAGVGGHCIPVDPLYLSYIADTTKSKATLISLSDDVNKQMPAYKINCIEKILNSDLTENKVIVVGIAYKQNISDIRESPAISILNLLREKGVQTQWHDNVVGKWGNEFSSNLDNQDLAIIVTMHNDLDIEKLKKFKHVFDCTGKVTWAKQI
jgi:UDP-N-acetyl-D-glucosamine dehydrogenase